MHLRYRTSLFAFLVGFSLWSVVVPNVFAADGEMRTWNDTTGKFKIKGKFLSLENGTVTLEREDGTELEIELKKLSPADQKFIADSAADNPFKSKKDDDPFKAKSKTKKPATTKTPPASPGASDGPRTVTVDWSSAEAITLSPPSDAWKVEVPKTAPLAFKPKNAPLPPKTGFFEGVKGMAISTIAGKAAVGFVVADPRPVGVSRVVICDFKSGKTTAPATAPGQMVPIALHDDGEQILMRRDEFGFGNLDRLEVWTLAGKAPEKSITWIPYDDVKGAGRDVMWAEFLDPDHLATSSRAGKLVIWKYPQIEPICSLDLVDGAVPGLSDDRKFIAYCNGSDVGLFDVTKREVVAQQATPEKLTWPYLAISPSGKRIGCISQDKVLVWDFATGKLERQFAVTGIHIHGGIEFPDDGFILGNSKFLIDVDNQLKFWTYDGQEQARSKAGWTFFAITDGDKKPGTLGTGQLPHPAAKDLLKKALTDPDLFVLKSGTKVKLNLEAIPAAERERVQKGLTQRLQGIGCQPDPNGTIDLIASMEGPKEREVSFRHSGDYKMQEYVNRLRFVFQGQPAWESSSSNVPFMVSLKRGENLGTHLKSLEKPEYGFFDRVELPKFVQKPVAGQAASRSLTLGQSKVTTSGIR